MEIIKIVVVIPSIVDKTFWLLKTSGIQHIKLCVDMLSNYPINSEIVVP